MWFVTTLGPIDEEYGPKYSRCVGYFETDIEAFRCVWDNCGDIAEDNYYPYAVVEEVQPGLYMSAESTPYFFKYIKEQNKYERTFLEDLPEVMQHLRGFSIG